MTNRSKLDKLNNSIQKLNQTINDSTDELYKFQNECGELLIQIVEDEKLLKDSLWDIEYFSEHIYLVYSGIKNDSFLGPINTLCSGSGHSWLDIEPGIQLRFDEDEVSLHFDEVKSILPFAKKHKMKITGSNLSDKLQKLKRESSALEQLIHQFAIK